MRASHINGIFWLIWLGLLGFTYFNSQDDPSSIFYDESRAFEQRFSAVRIAEADAYVESLPEAQSQISLPQTSQTSQLCIGIPSINRPTQSFLKHTLATLVDRLTPEQRSHVTLIVLLADREPRKHTAFGQPWLEALADEILIYDTGVALGDKISNKYHGTRYNVTGSARADRVENMRLDHSVLSERCHALGSPYFALVEDDIVASRDWFTRFQQGLEVVEKNSEKTGRDWIYLRLFYSEIFMGWNSEEWLVYSETIFLIYAVALICFMVLRRRLQKRARPSGVKELGGAAHRPYTNANFLAALVFGLWMPALIVLYFLAGRVSAGRLLPWPKPIVREMPQYGCCAQGLVFPERRLTDLKKLLQDPPFDFPGDMRLEGFAGDRGLVKWALEPSVFQHVGLKESSAGPRQAEVWNFSFERQHRKTRKRRSAP
jgi:hypothetical protein